MVDQAVLKLKLLGILVILILMTVADSVLYIFSVALDGGLALIAAALLMSIFRSSK